MRVRAMRTLLLICVVVAPLHLALAVEPSEILSDRAQESRAREISGNLRCLICQNESIDESSAPLARDLRELVRELIVEGKTDQEIYSYIESRYGEFALLRPRPRGSNLILYFSAPLLLAVGFVVALLHIQRRRRDLNIQKSALSKEEEQILDRLLNGNRR